MPLSASCGDPTPANGQSNVTKSPITSGYYSVGTIASFLCDSGYELDGSVSSTCHTSGSWNPSPPTCTQGNQTFLIFKCYTVSIFKYSLMLV